MVAALAMGAVGVANAQVTVYRLTVTNNSGSIENGISLYFNNADSSMDDISIIAPGNGVVLPMIGTGFAAQPTNGNQISASFDNLWFMDNFVATFTADNPNVQFSSGMWTINGALGPRVRLPDVRITPEATPEPAPFAALGLGLLPLLLRRKRR